MKKVGNCKMPENKNRKAGLGFFNRKLLVKKLHSRGFCVCSFNLNLKEEKSAQIFFRGIQIFFVKRLFNTSKPIGVSTHLEEQQLFDYPRSVCSFFPSSYSQNHICSSFPEYVSKPTNFVFLLYRSH